MVLPLYKPNGALAHPRTLAVNKSEVIRRLFKKHGWDTSLAQMVFLLAKEGIPSPSDSLINSIRRKYRP